MMRKRKKGQHNAEETKCEENGEKGAVATYQQEGPDVGYFVELHEKSQSLLVVTAVLTIHRETLPLQRQK